MHKLRVCLDHVEFGLMTASFYFVTAVKSWAIAWPLMRYSQSMERLLS